MSLSKKTEIIGSLDHKGRPLIPNVSPEENPMPTIAVPDYPDRLPHTEVEAPSADGPEETAGATSEILSGDADEVIADKLTQPAIAGRRERAGRRLAATLLAGTMAAVGYGAGKITDTPEDRRSDNQVVYELPSTKRERAPYEGELLPKDPSEMIETENHDLAPPPEGPPDPEPPVKPKAVNPEQQPGDPTPYLDVLHEEPEPAFPEEPMDP